MACDFPDRKWETNKTHLKSEKLKAEFWNNFVFVLWFNGNDEVLVIRTQSKQEL